MLVEDIRVDLGIRVGVDIIFNLGILSDITDDLGNIISDSQGSPFEAGNEDLIFNPREGDYYTISDGVATLHKVIGDSDISDSTGGVISDDTGGGISDSTPAGIIYLRDTNGNILFDSQGNPLIVTT